MKLFLLLMTIMFSASVLADCCNYEVESSNVQCSTIDHDQNDNCGDESQHSEAQHCHCSPINHFKIIPFTKIIVEAPLSIPGSPIPDCESSHPSAYEALIFHPPIA